MLVKSRCTGPETRFACKGLGFHLIEERCLIGVALAAAGYASTGFFREKPTEEEFAALEAYEAKHGMHFVVQTYFHAWCDAGKPDALTLLEKGVIPGSRETGFHKVQRAYGQVHSTYNETSCDGTCEPMCDWCNARADEAAEDRYL